jgi:hypothetical protein
VRGYLRRGRGARKSKKRVPRKIFAEGGKQRKIWWLAQETPQSTLHGGNILALAALPERFRPRPDGAGGPWAAAAAPAGQGRA